MVEQLEWKKRNMRAVQEAFKTVTQKGLKVLSEPQKFAELHKAENLAEEAGAYQLEYKQPEIKISTVVRKADAETEKEREIPLAVSRKESADFTVLPKAMSRREEPISQDDFLSALTQRIGSENVLRAHGKPVFYTDRERYEYILNQFYSGEHLSREDMDFKFDYESKMNANEENYFASYIKDKFTN